MMIGAIAFNAASVVSSSTVGNGTLNRIVPSSVSGMRVGKVGSLMGGSLYNIDRGRVKSNKKRVTSDRGCHGSPITGYGSRSTDHASFSKILTVT